MSVNFGDFTLTTSLSGTDTLVGYRNPVTNGEIRTTLSAVRSFVTGLGNISNVWVPASQFIPRTTSGAGVDSREIILNNYDELLFDPASTEFAQALMVLPSNYATGTVNARFAWTASGATGSVVWGMQGLSLTNTSALSGSFGTAQVSTGSITANNLISINPVTAPITLAGTPAANSPILFQIYRDAPNASDTLAIDARLLGVEISYSA